MARNRVVDYPSPPIQSIIMSSPQPSAQSVRFGVFEADLRNGELRRKGVKVRIQELPFRALSVLLSCPGEVVSRDELRRALWPENVFVEFDQGINSAIRRLREALGDSADEPAFVETVGRRGYRWIAPTHLPEPDSRRDTEKEEAAKEEKYPVAAPLPPKSSSWRNLVFVLPLLTLLFAVWIFRPGYRDAKAGAKPTAPPLSRTPHHAANREAEDYYFKGRFYWNKRTPESLNLALDSFTQAIVHDPEYSDAYVGLADCYNLLREYTVMPASEAYPRALAAANKAVELDANSSEAHASLAFVSFFGMWDTGTADEEFRRAIDLDPNNAKAHHWYATYLQSVRRFDESLEEIGRAQALDPNSSSILADKGILLWRAGRREQALRLLRQLEQADPDFVSPHRYLNFAYLEMGEYPGYLAEMKKEGLLLHNASLLAIEDAAEKGFAVHGAKGMFEGQLDQQKKAYSAGKLSPFFLAETYSQMGNTEEALKYLEACYDRHSDETINVPVDGALNNLHSVRAFQQFLAKVGLPQTN
ncbi:MAG TPA: winged helix-turn-helix domain-containing protein [Candidatus Deferrimicrobiaceae bacterium]|nr:winged helix-turn-helix domain-containing protein [Candidatus Deferrimicrobiaceae bacterium]